MNKLAPFLITDIMGVAEIWDIEPIPSPDLP